jgi:hypothetical protein
MTNRSFFLEHGHLICERLIPAFFIDELRLTIASALQSKIKIHSNKFTKNISFDAEQLHIEKLLNEGMIDVYKSNPKYLQYAVDAACNSSALNRLVSNDEILEKVSDLVGCGRHKLGLIQARLRVDLPSKFKKNMEKVHLGFHQEAGYFSQNVSQSTGLVAWIPLHDCAKKLGALEVLDGSHKNGLIEHNIDYKDKEKQRHKRATLQNESTNRYKSVVMECKKSDVAFQNFYLMHKSGLNTYTKKVRYTVVVRYSDITARDWQPQSWS